MPGFSATCSAAAQFRGKAHDAGKETLAHQLQHEPVGCGQDQRAGIRRARLRRQGADPGAELLRGHFLLQSAQASVPEIVHLRAYSLRAGLEALRRLLGARPRGLILPFPNRVIHSAGNKKSRFDKASARGL